MPDTRLPAPRRTKLPERKLSTGSLRKLARTHTAVALQVLAEVAVSGSSEASRIAAAMALLDRGYGKTGTGSASEIDGRAPTLYQRIELIDGSAQKPERDHHAADSPD